MPDARSNPGQGSTPPRYPGSFLLAVREALAQAGWQPRKWLGSAVDCLDHNGREQLLGLENLYRRLRREDRETWPKLVLEMLRSVPAEPTQTLALAEATERILVRIGPPMGSIGDPDKEIWFKPLVGKQLGLTLVVDYPNTMSYVNQGQLADSGRDADIWLEHALENLRRRTPADAAKVIHEESGLYQCELGDAYDSSRALILETMLPEGAGCGYFVVIPGRDQLLFLPVSKRSLEFLPWLRMIATKIFQTAPYPISPEVFWVRRGTWRPFEIEVEAEKVIVTPPAEFEAVLRRLMGDDADGVTE